MQIIWGHLLIAFTDMTREWAFPSNVLFLAVTREYRGVPKGLGAIVTLVGRLTSAARKIAMDEPR